MGDVVCYGHAGPKVMGRIDDVLRLGGGVLACLDSHNIWTRMKFVA